MSTPTGQGRPPPSRARIIGTMVSRDFRTFTRNPFILYMTVALLAIYPVIVYLMPDAVEETIHLGVAMPADMPLLPQEAQAAPGLEIHRFDTVEALKAAVDDNDPELFAGVAVAPDAMARAMQGEVPHVEVVVRATTPPEMREVARAMVREMLYAASGQDLPVTMPDEKEAVLGEDRVGKHLSPKRQSAALMAMLVLIMEMMALGTTVARDIQQRTVVAILVTPAQLTDFLVAKLLFGAGLAFTETTLLLGLVGLLFEAPLVLLVTTLLGAFMATGFGLWAGSRGRDFTEVSFQSIMILIPLMIPAVGALFPGTASAWIKVFPSYPLAATFEAVANRSAGFVDVLPWLGAIFLWDVAIAAFGLFTLKRRVEAL